MRCLVIDPDDGLAGDLALVDRLEGLPGPLEGYDQADVRGHRTDARQLLQVGGKVEGQVGVALDECATALDGFANSVYLAEDQP